MTGMEAVKKKEKVTEKPLTDKTCEKQQLPKIKALSSKIEESLLQVCPKGIRESLACEILKLNPKNIEEKIKKINSALALLIGYYSWGHLIVSEHGDDLASLAYSPLENKHIAESFVKDPASVVKALWKITRSGQFTQYAFSVLRDEDTSKNFARDPEAVVKELMARRDVLNKKFGIEYFERYTTEFIAQLYQLALSPTYRQEKPNALLILPKTDWTDSFYMPELYGSLLKGYRVIVVEVDHDKEVVERLESITKTYGKLDFLLIGGHGSFRELELGKTFVIFTFDRDRIDIGDLEDLGGAGAWEKYTNNGVKVVLVSCSVADNSPFYVDNVKSIIEKLTCRKVIAPDTDAGVNRFIFGSDDKVLGVEFLIREKAEEGNWYRVIKRQEY